MYISSNRFVALVFSLIALVGSAAVASAAPIFADSAVLTNTTSFGSGLVIGAPDNGGAFLSNTFDPPDLMGEITAGFSGGLVDGAGDDIVIHDCCAGSSPLANEFANVFVSTDGVVFTFLGAYGGAAQVNSFDLNGIFAGVVHFVRIVNNGDVNSPDIDAFQGNFAVPEPVSLALLGVGLAAVSLRRRMRKSA